MKMAEAYWVAEDMFVKKMEGFIREDLGVPDVSSQNPDESIKIALHSKWFTDPQINEMIKGFIKFKEANK